jgi:hypothetical protein
LNGQSCCLSQDVKPYVLPPAFVAELSSAKVRNDNAKPLGYRSARATARPNRLFATDHSVNQTMGKDSLALITLFWALGLALQIKTSQTWALKAKTNTNIVVM